MLSLETMHLPDRAIDASQFCTRQGSIDKAAIAK